MTQNSSAAAPHFPVIGIGASSGGLEACAKFLAALPPNPGMAFVLVQHLDPAHPSMLVELLTSHTTMSVVEVTDGMVLKPNCFYIIPPGTYLSVASGGLHLVPPTARHGARMPFDFLLRSMAEEYGDQAVGVILSGTGADGSLGLKEIREQGGLVIAQNPDQAAYGGMPRNAIESGAVDLVLPLEKIPPTLIDYHHRRGALSKVPRPPAGDWLPKVIELLQSKTPYDFRPYKEGTLRRRIERRVAMTSAESVDMETYLGRLQGDPEECDRLVADLLINVTSFFRDPQIFDYLAQNIIPQLVQNHAADQSLRIWTAGCSTGEETYSLAMLFREAITAAKREIKLQIFASDVDADAVAFAREGLYPATVTAEISPARLARFFSKDDHGYRVLPDLRASIVFAVQDVLSDPPFSRLDLVSCRNLLIYLRPDAQDRVLSFFHFALRPGGVLMLGSAETIGAAKGRFEVISKQDRLYRHVGRARPGETGYLFAGTDMPRLAAQAPRGQASRQIAIAEICRRLILDTYAPAAVMVNLKLESLYSLGPTERYLRVPLGHPSYDLLAMVKPHLRIRLRAGIHQAITENVRVTVPGGRTIQDGKLSSFVIAVQPASVDGENLLLICFIEEPTPTSQRPRTKKAHDAEWAAEIEQRLEVTQTELQAAIHSLETSNEEQKAINEEALSVNEEYQSTNEELLTSKEELQSLNEELTALNSQLQETLELQRTTASDLQNILFSTDVATIFLDRDLDIRFFTPATRSLFSIISTDIGRPLADLTSMAPDEGLQADARTVLETLVPIEHEIKAQNGKWFIRRILPYRGQGAVVEGVVITFADITERRRAADALELAKREAQQANLAKSRFLAAASHDLRQPLQALGLMRSVLERRIQRGEKEQSLSLVARIDETTIAMALMLDTLLDINQLEAGTVRPQIVRFNIDDLLGRLRDEFTFHAEAQKLLLRVMPCGLAIYSDPQLLEQMLRNLLSNALKYTKQGKVLLGCRRRAGVLSIEIWDTGLGIDERELQLIFEEYHQIDNQVRHRAGGLGLGLSIVQRLGGLLAHPIHVRSQLGKGSVFSIDVMIAPDILFPGDLPLPSPLYSDEIPRLGAILIIEDDLDLKQLLDITLTEEGHTVVTASDGIDALDLLAVSGFQPDLILSDYNLPNGMDGLTVAARIRERLGRIELPVIILTGDIATDTLRMIAGADCIQLNKPVEAAKVILAIHQLLPEARIDQSVTPPPLEDA